MDLAPLLRTREAQLHVPLSTHGAISMTISLTISWELEQPYVEGEEVVANKYDTALYVIDDVCEHKRNGVPPLAQSAARWTRLFRSSLVARACHASFLGPPASVWACSHIQREPTWADLPIDVRAAR